MTVNEIVTFQARETVKEYDKATVGLESTVKETSELEKRANIAGIELIKATEKLNAIRRELKDGETKRSKQERLLKDVGQVIIIILTLGLKIFI